MLFTKDGVHMRKTDKSINGQYTYFAFIAYTHDDYADAEDLYKRLQRFAMPAKIRKENSIAKRLVPMFLDHHYMNPGTYEKRDNEALKKSKYLIVVCSCKLHEHDENVNKEISDFLSYGNTYEQIIPYIIDKDIVLRLWQKKLKTNITFDCSVVYPKEY